MIREILKMGDERLLRIAQPVPSELLGSEELQRLIDDMFETMHHVGGVGLAAPRNPGTDRQPSQPSSISSSSGVIRGFSRMVGGTAGASG